MKALFTLGLIVAAAASAQASAATYYGSCQSCTGSTSGSVWLSRAATVGAFYSAALGDNIALCKDAPSGAAVVASYEVVDVPVVNSSDVAWLETIIFNEDGEDCAGLGFP